MKFLIILICFLISGKIFAHPVIYKGGLVYWGTMMPTMSTHRLGYTFHPKSSLEINTSRFDDINQYNDYRIGVNFLLKRWLQQDSQGNIYLGAFGGYFEQADKEGEVGHLMLSGDWESRSIYTAGSIGSYFLDGENFQRYSYRIGFAPYVVGMSTLQSWMILKLEYFRKNDRKLWVTPMMRFFYRNVLWELGATMKGSYMLTLMTHF